MTKLTQAIHNRKGCLASPIIYNNIPYIRIHHILQYSQQSWLERHSQTYPPPWHSTPLGLWPHPHPYSSGACFVVAALCIALPLARTCPCPPHHYNKEKHVELPRPKTFMIMKSKVKSIYTSELGRAGKESGEDNTMW